MIVSMQWQFQAQILKTHRAKWLLRLKLTALNAIPAASRRNAPQLISFVSGNVTRAVGFADFAVRRSRMRLWDRKSLSPPRKRWIDTSVSARSSGPRVLRMKRSTPSLPWEGFFVEAWIRLDLFGLIQAVSCLDLKESRLLLFFGLRVVSQLFLAELFFSKSKVFRRRRQRNSVSVSDCYID